MKRTLAEPDNYLIGRQLAGVHVDDEWIHSYRVGTQYGPRIDALRQLHAPSAVPVSRNAQETSRIEPRRKTRQQIEALGTWEDEGGTTVAPARKIDGVGPHVDPT